GGHVVVDVVVGLGGVAEVRRQHRHVVDGEGRAVVVVFAVVAVVRGRVVVVLVGGGDFGLVDDGVAVGAVIDRRGDGQRGAGRVGKGADRPDAAGRHVGALRSAVADVGQACREQVGDLHAGGAALAGVGDDHGEGDGVALFRRRVVHVLGQRQVGALDGEHV